jgi:DNA-directed RNA polymerase specialized sigma24 family protein
VLSATGDRRRRSASALESDRRSARGTSRPALARRASTRSRVEAALDRCHQREWLAIALILLERLSPAEAAGALGLPVRRLDRTFNEVLARLRRAAASQADAPAEARARKAS